MRRKRTIKSLSSDSSDEDEPLSKLTNGKQKKPSNIEEESSSESDIENYLQRPDKLDLDSPFFNLEKPTSPSQKASAPVSCSIDSDSENENEHKLEVNESAASTSKHSFTQLDEYTKKLEEAKRHVEEYNARQQAKKNEDNVVNLLVAGESKIFEEMKQFESSLGYSDFEESESEKDEWEEIKGEEKGKEKNEIPKEGLQITVDMPGPVKKKKGTDLLLAIKRRINRMRKENQVLIHKVHLLCWIAHGKYVNLKLNSENTLAVALSLLPSEKSYPTNRTDLNYLEQILKWYRNTVTLVEASIPNGKTLEELLEIQIAKREAFNKKMLVYIFISILRSLGIQCRLVLSFQIEPLRPPNSELHSLSSKDNVNEKKMKNLMAGTSCQSTEKKEIKSRHKDKMHENKSSETKFQTLDTKDEKIVKSKSAGANKLGENDSKSLSLINKNNVNVQNEVKSRRTNHRVGENAKDEITLEKKVRSRSTGGSKSKIEETKKRSKEGNEKINSKISVGKSVAGSQKSNASERVSKVPKSPKSKNKSSSEHINNMKTKPRTSSRLQNMSQKAKKLESKSTVDVVSSNKERDSMRKTRSCQKKQSVPQLDGANDSDTAIPALNSRKTRQKVKKYRDSSESEDDNPKTRACSLKKNTNYVKKDVRSDIIHLVKKSIKEQKELERMKKVSKRKSTVESDDDSDYVPEVVTKKRRSEDDDTVTTIKVKRRVQVKQDSEKDKKKKQGLDVWIEVFLESEEKWISVDVTRGQVHCVKELYTRATQPVSYVVAWNNNDTLKDVTRRYCINFNTTTRKLRVEAKWWETTLQPFIGTKTARAKEEDDELERQQLEKPLPTTISEYKNHPLYVLKRHLLKFEALYPPDPPPLGFVRKEPVYSRQCVYTLHSREIWLKHAKTVKPGEQPYKIVKARPKWDRLSNKMITDQLLEVFGPWQVEDYVPPTAENGIVPRNAFGNVELFKPCMLPKGTVHLKLPGLNKIARRMNIDCAAALIGFDFHGGWNHPTYDGYIVCEEFADELVAAWEFEQDEIEKREQEKTDKRVFGNWKKLIKGLLIRERLKAKYEFGDSKKNKVTKIRQIASDSE